MRAYDTGVEAVLAAADAGLASSLAGGFRFEPAVADADGWTVRVVARGGVLLGEGRGATPIEAALAALVDAAPATVAEPVPAAPAAAAWTPAD